MGRSLALRNDLLIVGASRKEDAGGVDRGAAYAFKRDAGGIADNWRQVLRFSYPGSAPSPWFGDEVVLDADNVIIGARRDSEQANDQGSITVFPGVGSPQAEPSDFDLWRHLHFPAGMLLEREAAESLWGASADPDFDRIANLWEYLAGTDPNSPEEVPQNSTDIVDGVVRFTADRAATSCASTYVLESNDLLRWRRVSGTLRAGPADKVVHEVVLANVPNRARYLRLAVEED